MLSKKPPHVRGEATAYIMMMTDPMRSIQARYIAT